MRGVEQPQAKAGSFVLDVSPAQPGVGEANEIMVGSKLYIHYPSSTLSMRRTRG